MSMTGRFWFWLLPVEALSRWALPCVVRNTIRVQPYGYSTRRRKPRSRRAPRRTGVPRFTRPPRSPGLLRDRLVSSGRTRRSRCDRPPPAAHDHEEPAQPQHTPTAAATRLKAFTSRPRPLHAPPNEGGCSSHTLQSWQQSKPRIALRSWRVSFSWRRPCASVACTCVHGVHGAREGSQAPCARASVCTAPKADCVRR
eukprot:7389972-Prymnesium_polylepis.1